MQNEESNKTNLNEQEFYIFMSSLCIMKKYYDKCRPALLAQETQKFEKIFSKEYEDTTKQYLSSKTKQKKNLELLEKKRKEYYVDLRKRYGRVAKLSSELINAVNTESDTQLSSMINYCEETALYAAEKLINANEK